MKDSLRQCTSWLHTWTGLVVGWVLFFVFVTGTAGYFQHEITRWMQPERDAPRALVLDEPEVQVRVQAPCGGGRGQSDRRRGQPLVQVAARVGGSRLGGAMPARKA